MRTIAMKTIQGPAIFLAQFAGDNAPFNSLDAHRRLGRGARLQGRADPDLGRAPVRPRRRPPKARPIATRCKGTLAQPRPADHRAVDPPAGPAGGGAPGLRRRLRRLRGARGARRTRPRASSGRCSSSCCAARRRRAWALTAHATFSGALAWPYLYRGRRARRASIDEAFDELARRWRPILDAFDDAGVDVAYEVHPGEDLHDGVSYEMFLDRVGNHPRACLALRPEPLPAAAARLSGLHRPLPRADQEPST